MKKHSFFKPLWLALPLCTLFSVTVLAQQPQWAKRGGSNDIIPTGGGMVDEKVVAISTDAEGNVFALAPVGISSVDIDGVPKETYSVFDGSGGANLDYMVSSFACDGTFRWAKVLGGPVTDEFRGLGTDAAGNVYTAGMLLNTQSTFSTGIHFDEDLMYPPSDLEVHKQTLFLVKYKNDGTFEWAVTPEADNVPFVEMLVNDMSLALQVDPQGNNYWLCHLGPGTYAGSYVNTAPGKTYHILKYNADGEFVEGHPFDINLGLANKRYIKMVRNHKTGIIYITGYRFDTFEPEVGGVTVCGQEVTKPMYIAAFTSEGEFLWFKQSTDDLQLGTGFNDLALDEEGNIYITGGMRTGDSFDGQTFTSTQPHNFPFLMKLDSDGNLLWKTNGISEAAIQSDAVTVNGNEVAVTGGGIGLQWAGLNMPMVPNQNYDIFIIRFNKNTGEYIDYERFESTFDSRDIGGALTSRNGSYYVGGEFAKHLYVGEDDVYNDGQETDFVIAKYGDDVCECAVLTPSFTMIQEADGNGFNFEYTGSEEYFTIEWFFGNQGTSTDKNPYFNFTQAGQYEVCITVTNLCGATESCQQVNVTAGAETFGLADVKVYPNPAQSFVTIDSKEGVDYELYSVLGSKVLYGSTKAGAEQVSLQGLAGGVYMLKLQNAQGMQSTQKLVVK